MAGQILVISSISDWYHWAIGIITDHRIKKIDLV